MPLKGGGAAARPAFPRKTLTPLRFLTRQVESKKSKAKGMYQAPLYLYPLRTGSRERPSFMLPLELKSGTAAC